MAAEEFTEQVRAVLTGESLWLAKQRRTFKRIPSPPRSKGGAAPFARLGGVVFRDAGVRQSSGNPALCKRCITDLRKRQLTGVEIPITLLFSDIRGSTAMGERMRPATSTHSSTASINWHRIRSLPMTEWLTKSWAMRLSGSSSAESSGRAMRQQQ